MPFTLFFKKKEGGEKPFRKGLKSFQKRKKTGRKALSLCICNPLLFLYQEKQDDQTVDKAIDKIVIIFVIGASLVFLMVSALTITVLVRRQALKEKMRQIIPDNNPVYGENFYYEDSTVTDINDCYD